MKKGLPIEMGSAMNRRSFLRGGTGAILAFTRSGEVAKALERNTTGASPAAHPQNCIFVSATGDDKSSGTISRPLKSFQAAQAAVRNLKKENSGTISVYFRAGTYYLPDTIVFTPADSGKTGAPIILRTLSRRAGSAKWWESLVPQMDAIPRCDHEDLRLIRNDD